MGVWASTEVDKIDLKRDVEEVSLGMTRYSSHYLPTEVKTEHDKLNNSNKYGSRRNMKPSTKMQNRKILHASYSQYYHVLFFFFKYINI